MKKKVLWVCHWESPYSDEWKGGMGKYMHTLSGELSKTGFQIDILTPNFSQYPSQQILHPNRVRLIRLDVPIEEDIRNPRDMKKFSDSVVDYFERNQDEYSLVHAHYWSSHMAGEALSQRGIPYILQLHQLDKPMRVAFQKLDLEYKLNEWRHETERTAVENADRTIFVSNTQLNEFVRYYFNQDIPKSTLEKINVVLNGVDVKNFRPLNSSQSHVLQRKYDLPENPFVIGYCGRLDNDKAVDRMFYSIPLLLDKLSESERERVKVMVTGKGNDVRYLEKVVRSLGLKKKVQFYGYQTGRDLLEKFQISDVGIVPSIHETFGLSAVEFMSCGEPVIVFKDSGGPEEIVNGTAGNVVDSPEQMADVLQNYFRDSELRKKIGEDGRKRCLQLYNWKNVAKETKKIYEEVIDSKIKSTSP